jgi:HEAT repeat protein
MKKINNAEVKKKLKVSPAYMVKLIKELIDSEDYARKHNARITLVKKGNKVIPHMLKLLSSKNRLLRMEAAKVIELVADISSIPLLITLLNDKVFDIRWIAAQGLIRIGRKSIKPLLKSVCSGKNSLFLDNRAHHVLNKLLYENEKLELNSLMLSLDNYHETGETAPFEASKALKQFKFNN